MLARFRAAAWALPLAFALLALPALAEAPAGEKPVCGRDLMTPEEVAAHKEKMRGFATQEERAAYKAQHRAKMLERAKQRGVELPAEGCGKAQAAATPGGAAPAPPGTKKP